MILSFDVNKYRLDQGCILTGTKQSTRLVSITTQITKLIVLMKTKPTTYTSPLSCLLETYLQETWLLGMTIAALKGKGNSESKTWLILECECWVRRR